MPIFKFQGPDGKIHQIEGPEGATEEQAFQILQQQLGPQPTDYTQTAKEQATGVVRGAAQGVAGTLVSLSDILPDPSRMIMPKSALAALDKGREDVRRWAREDPSTVGQAVGQIAGAVGPLLVQPELIPARITAFAPRIGQIANSLLGGAIGGALAPTEEGTLASHARGAGFGALAGGGSVVGGKALSAAGRLSGKMAQHGAASAQAGVGAAILEHIGVPAHYSFFPLWWALHSTGLARLAQKATQGGMRVAGEAAQISPAAAGAVAGKITGGTNGQVPTPTQPSIPAGPTQREPTPIQADFEALGSARGRGQQGRDNNPATDQRTDSRWTNPDYFQ